MVQGDNVKQYLNGKLVNEGSKAYPASGKILIQSEGAEVYFRQVKLYPLNSLREMPSGTDLYQGMTSVMPNKPFLL